MSENTSDTNRYYEIGFLLSPTLEESNAETVSNEIEVAISKIGGTKVDGEMPKLRKLAYPIYKVIDGKKIAATTGYFGWVKFSVEAESSTDNINNLNETVKKMGELLRFLVIKTVKEKTYTPKEPEQFEEENEPSELVEESLELAEEPAPEVENDSREGEVVETESEE